MEKGVSCRQTLGTGFANACYVNKANSKGVAYFSVLLAGSKYLVTFNFTHHSFMEGFFKFGHFFLWYWSFCCILCVNKEDLKVCWWIRQIIWQKYQHHYYFEVDYDKIQTYNVVESTLKCAHILPIPTVNLKLYVLSF